MRRGFFRRLPQPIRRLWYLIVVIAFAEVLLLAAAIRAGGEWPGIAWQFCSLSIGPLSVGALVVLVVGIVANRQGRSPGRRSHSERSEVPYEIAFARGTTKLVRSAIRSSEGKAVIRLAARLTVATQAAMRHTPHSETMSGSSGKPASADAVSDGARSVEREQKAGDPEGRGTSGGHG